LRVVTLHDTQREQYAKLGLRSDSLSNYTALDASYNP
jgi:hypothetical protein